MKSYIYRQPSKEEKKEKEHKQINITKKWKLLYSRDVKLMRER
jgi:hypothetical protein